MVDTGYSVDYAADADKTDCAVVYADKGDAAEQTQIQSYCYELEGVCRSEHRLCLEGECFHCNRQPSW